MTRANFELTSKYPAFSFDKVAASRLTTWPPKMGYGAALLLPTWQFLKGADERLWMVGKVLVD